jgi:hypothetical protein
MVVMVSVVVMPVALMAVPVGLRTRRHDAERQYRRQGDPDPTQSFSLPTLHPWPTGSLANRPIPTVP